LGLSRHANNTNFIISTRLPLSPSFAPKTHLPLIYLQKVVDLNSG
jgi:hypothetical protein